MNRPAEIIKTAYKRIGIKSDAGISRETGFQYDRLHRVRMKNPETLTLAEIKLLQRHAYFTDQELLELVKADPWKEAPG